MIKSFKHKGLAIFFETGNKAGIQANHAEKLKLQLSALNRATSPRDVNAPGWQLHQLSGNLKDHWSIKVNGNWRITFRFNGNDVEVVDYQDYH
ncbi:Plasmid maintenance system killer protein; Toxin higB-1 [Neisseria zoodegmatis]|uniref:Killer protein n=2 Tax=Neisseria zoodegmatis TaxID=326523 RepID=A0AB38DQN5_9NEIS|nr:type II toxin-antitoxin system RelE/ParE family toxin [Neisseria zoodegmatis]OSI09857.1 Killer protein [Neisseria zoodegmatis]SNU79744.1 Plasmid maintenance system killer protein; Toxin higB-1 [Neisseria zoodegmatis]